MERRTGITLAGMTAVMLAGWSTGALTKHVLAQAAATPTQQQVPDAPRPQALPKLNTIVPTAADIPNAPAAPPAPPVANATSIALPSTPVPTQAAVAAAQDENDDSNMVIPVAGQGAYVPTRIVRNVTLVEVPFLVKDSRGQLIPGITPRDVQILENNAPQPIRYFTADPFPLSVAFVIDQSVTFDTMQRVNQALGALQGAFSPADEVAVFTYNNGVKMQDPIGFDGATSARLGAILEQSKGKGRDPQMLLGGPLAQTTLINNQNVDPNTAPNHRSSNTVEYAEREFHTLNDAILAAAIQVNKAGRSRDPKVAHRRRIVYVISDGKEYGSKAKEKDVVKFCQTNNIAVYATLIGDSSLPVVGFLDRIHLPYTMRDNALPRYTTATGGQLDAEIRETGIERSFSKIAEEARAQYFLAFYSHLPPYAEKFRTLEVRVYKPNVSVIAKEGYYANPTLNGPGGAVPPAASPAAPATTAPAPSPAQP